MSRKWQRLGAQAVRDLDGVLALERSGYRAVFRAQAPGGWLVKIVTNRGVDLRFVRADPRRS